MAEAHAAPAAHLYQPPTHAPQAAVPPPLLQVAVESTGDESGDAAQVEKQLLSLRKSKAKLKASKARVPQAGQHVAAQYAGRGLALASSRAIQHQQCNPAAPGHPSAASNSPCRTG